MKSNTDRTSFPMLSKLIKSTLSLSHGNADVKHGFSENASLVTDDRFSSRSNNNSINGLRGTKDAVTFCGLGKVHEGRTTIPL